MASAWKIIELANELDDEKSKGRLIESTDPGKEPLPCYFNTGCGVYSDGFTAIEIESDFIRLAKWNRDSSQGALDRQIYNEDKLSNLLKKI
jgi:hypothetical protein